MSSVSFLGAAVSLAILAPSLLLLLAPPRDAPATMPVVPWAVATLERVGQAGCLVAPALTAGAAGVDGWFAVIVALVAAYYGTWARYLAGSRRFALLYAPIGPVPVPMAVLPVLAFLATAAWAHSWIVAVLAVVLAVGHLAISAGVARVATAS